MQAKVLEREAEVEAARARLSEDLAKLRSAETYDEFTDNLKQTVISTKHSIMEEAISRTRSMTDDVLDSLKAKASANPTAVLVIGAGLAWHLLRRPPVVTALIGGGLVSLMRTSAERTGKDTAEYLNDAKSNLKDQVNEAARAGAEAGRDVAGLAASKASDLASQAREAAREAVESTKARAVGLSEQVQEAGNQAAKSLKAKAADIADRTGETVRSTFTTDHNADVGTGPETDEDEDEYELGAKPVVSRESILVGAAGLAVAAALALVLQRPADTQPQNLNPTKATKKRRTRKPDGPAGPRRR